MLASDECKSPGGGRIGDAPKDAKATQNANVPGNASAKAAKLQAQQELQVLRAAELKAADEWNEIFKGKGNIKNHEVLLKFWTEVKSRLAKRFGNIGTAFRKLDSSGDGQISFLEFCDMLHLINMPLDQRIARQLFDRASGGDRSLSMEELKRLLLEKTLLRLRYVLAGINGKQERVQGHVFKFIRRLALNGENVQISAVDRFQRKLTPFFCKEVWQEIRKHIPLNECADAEPTLEKAVFTKALHGLVARDAGTRLLPHEIMFMERIFDRADITKQRGHLPVTDLMAMLILCSPEFDGSVKIAQTFEFFDSDGDGCLLYEQIMPMFIRLCAFRPLVTEDTSIHYDAEFQTELSLQEGRRAYELTLWHLQRISKVEGGIVTQGELVEAMQSLPEVLDSLIPGILRIRWVLKPSYSEGNVPRSPVWPPPKAPLQPPSPSGTSPPIALLPVQPAAAFGRRSSVYASTSMLSKRPIAGSPNIAGQNGLTTNSSLRLRMLAGEPGVVFKAERTSKFKSSLRGWGDIRLFELTSGFIAPPEVKGAEDDGNEGANAISSPGHGGGQKLAIARSTSEPTLSGRGHGRPREISGKRALGPGISQLLPRKAENHHGSPVGSRAKSQSGLWDDLGTHVTAMPSEKWGPESADRFRLFAAATIASGRNWMDRPDPGGNFTHKCFVCLGQHRLKFDGGRN